MPRKLENRIAMITGASRGIGRAIALRFAEEGADFFICARTEAPLKDAVTEMTKLGGKVVPEDVRKRI